MPINCFFSWAPRKWKECRQNFSRGLHDFPNSNPHFPYNNVFCFIHEVATICTLSPAFFLNKALHQWIKRRFPDNRHFGIKKKKSVVFLRNILKKQAELNELTKWNELTNVRN